MTDLKPHGWFWQIIHEPSGDVMSEGYSRWPVKDGPTDTKPFVLRSTALYAFPQIVLLQQENKT